MKKTTTNPATFRVNSLAELKEGDPVTLICIGGIAHTSISRVIFCQFDGKGRLIYKENARKRNMYAFTPKHDNLIFAGHLPTPFTDSDTGNFMGNACLNFIGTPEGVKDRLTANLNTLFDYYDHVMCRSLSSPGDEVEPVYMEQAKETGSPVVQDYVRRAEGRAA